ncbi:aminotransferase class I/II-fold pyridoxal phosphate-dependent enzyme [Mycolicibacterium nivoides]|uniref:Aminotransferase class I/II-fold pyridoxal phosphate-dependent enzyme n=1 Tax=Mycolicibacterium nivoides TaxID=2487344 RepID=A0ABW9LMB8_9MYCO
MQIAAQLADNTFHASQSNVPYVDAVKNLADRATARLLVPGHGGGGDVAPALTSVIGAAPVHLDVTPLLWGIDRGPDDGLEAARMLAAQAWGARRTWFLTNGASQANRMALVALAGMSRGDRSVVAQRSAHSSFVDGLVVTGLTPEFVLPTIDTELGIAHGVHPSDVAAALARRPYARGVYVISPSYFGAVSDVRAIADVAHTHGIPLIVDNAWGAHFGFHPDLPANPLSLGADLLVSSTHKMGGSLHQSAMLHLAPGPFAEELEQLVDRAHRLTQSTSWSSILTASLDIARRELATKPERISSAMAGARRLIAALESAGIPVASTHFSALRGVVANDPLNVTIDVRGTGIDGAEVRERLALDYGILTEMATASTVVALIPPGLDVDEHAFVDALTRIARGHNPVPRNRIPPLPAVGEMLLTPRDAYFASAETVAAEDAIGRISAESLAAYPPGIPNVMPGEIIARETVQFLRAVSTSPGGYVRGALNPAITHLRVVASGLAT